MEVYSKPPIEIRPLDREKGSADYTAAFALAHMIFEQRTWGFDSEIRRAAFVFGAISEGLLAGYCVGRLPFLGSKLCKVPEASVEWLGVRPDLQDSGRGIGSALLTKAERFMINAGTVEQVHITSNPDARGFYERHGYTSSFLNTFHKTLRAPE